MKESSHIDELLNGYIDGVLTSRQHTELQRLKANDPRVEHRLTELQKCKMLVSSLPVVEAPADMLERVKASLGSKAARPAAVQTETQVETEQPAGDKHPGARQLMFRRIFAAAAMIVLLTALAIIVYSITAPPKTTDSLIARLDKTSASGTEQPGLQQGLTDNTGTTVAKASAGVENQQMTAGLAPAANRFSATLELKTGKLLAADIAVKKVLEEDGAEDFADLPSKENEYAYSLDCGEQRFNEVLSGLENIWTDFSSAALIFDNAQTEQPVVIEKITTWQLAEIAAQYNPQRRLKAAQYYAVMNNVQQFLPQQQAHNTGEEDVLDLIDMPKPKPVLTKDEAALQDSAQSNLQVDLTIIIKAE